MSDPKPDPGSPPSLTPSAKSATVPASPGAPTLSPAHVSAPGAPPATEAMPTSEPPAFATPAADDPSDIGWRPRSVPVTPAPIPAHWQYRKKKKEGPA